MTEIKHIAETIQSEKCVLFLGPGILLTNDNQTFWEKMLASMGIEQTDNSSYFKQDDLFLFKESGQRNKMYYDIKRFFHENQEEIQQEIFQKIAKIKFNTVISISPDVVLRDTLETLNIPHEFAFYDSSLNPGKVQQPKSDRPLVYNLFGSIEEGQSMIITHGDLYKFIFAILGQHNLPGEIQNILLNSENYLFLGFDFDKWYMQILLHLLNQYDENDSFARYAFNKNLSEEDRSFFTELFKINFIEKDIPEFLDKLYHECSEMELIRDFKEGGNMSLIDKIDELIRDDLLKEVFQLLTDFFKEKQADEYADQVLIMENQLNRLQRRIDEEVIDSAKAEVESNKIRMNILKFKKYVKELESA